MKRKLFIPLVAAALVLPLASCGGSDEVYFGLGSKASFNTSAQTDVDLVAAQIGRASCRERV